MAPRYYMLVLAASTLAGVTPAAAQSVFDGTWKIDTGSAQLPEKPDVLVMKDGMYRCKTCTPPFSVKMDGAFHPVADQDFDAMAIKAVGPRKVEYRSRKDGKVVGTQINTVSADGSTMTRNITSTNPDTGATVKTTLVAKRIGKAQTGAHLSSGTWKAEKVDVSDNGLTMTFKSDGKTLTARSGTGTSWTASFGGPFVPVNGTDGDMVAVKMNGPRSFTETYKSRGKVTSIDTITVTADGKTSDVVFRDPAAKTDIRVKAYKQ